MPALFSQLFQLLSQALYLLLHVTGGGTFPRALSAAQERQCLEEMAQGSQAARQKLIEHNLRLVALEGDWLRYYHFLSSTFRC